MDKILKIGLVIADAVEYEPMRDYILANGGQRDDMFTREGHSYTVKSGDKKIFVHAVLCGIGTVNASAASMFFAAKGFDVIINVGLSGGMQAGRESIVIGTRFIEHDFDLTALGHKPYEKPLQEYVYAADELLLDSFLNFCPKAECGPMVSGDSFISDAAVAAALVSDFGAVACDMESSAVAYVARLSGMRFAVIRRISDDAGDNATDLYKEMNVKDKMHWMNIVFDWINTFFDIPDLWISNDTAKVK